MKKRFFERLSVDPAPVDEPTGGGGDAGGDTSASTSGEGESEVDKLRRALEASRAEARQYRAESRQYQGQLKQVGETNPALLEEAQRKAEEAEQRRQLAEQQAELRVQQMQRQLEEKTGRALSEAKAAREAAEREALRVKTERDFLAAEGLVDASSVDGRTPFDYVWQLHGNRVAEDAQGAYIKDAQGLPETDPETNKRITVRQFFDRLRDDPVHGIHFKPRYGSGGGSRSGLQGRVGPGVNLDGMSSKDMLREGLKAEREHVRRTA